MTWEDLVWLANRRGHPVVLRKVGRNDGLLHSSGVIYVDPKLHSAARRQVLAHELGHSTLGHDRRDGRWSPADERAADLWAAQLLINPLEYRLAERMYGTDARLIAEHLDLTVTVVTRWQQHHDRRGRTQRMEDIA